MAIGDVALEPDIEYSLLSGQEKAGVLLSALGTETSQLIFNHLRDNDVKRLINAMANVKKAPIWMVKRVLFGVVKSQKVAELGDIQVRETFFLTLLAIFVLLIGLWPAPLLDVMHVSVENLLRQATSTKL